MSKLIENKYFGYKFLPTHEQNFLMPKVEGKCTNFATSIFEEDVYAKHPQLLQNWDHDANLFDHERYFWVRRSPKAMNHNVKVDRVLKSNEGFWRKSNCVQILDSQGQLIGHVSLLNFYAYTDDTNNDQQPKKAVKTEFRMHEFVLPGNTFQEWAVCKITDGSIEKKNGQFEKKMKR